MRERAEEGLRAELVQLCARLLPVEAIKCDAVLVLLESLQWRLIKPGGHLHLTLQGSYTRRDFNPIPFNASSSDFCTTVSAAHHSFGLCRAH